MQAGRTILITVVAALAALTGLAGCEQDQAAPQDQPATTSVPESSTSVAPATITTTTTTRLVPATTTRPAPTTTTRPAPTTTARPVTTTTQPLSKAEATSRLCKAIESADAAIQQGSLVAGGLRLSSGIGTYEKVADAAVVSAARSMLRAGLDGDPDAYGSARQAASTACTRAGFPIRLGGPVQCVTTPCP